MSARPLMGRRVCSWCEREGRPADMGPAPTEHDTHGICPAHLAAELAKIAIGPMRGGSQEVSRA